MTLPLRISGKCPYLCRLCKLARSYGSFPFHLATNFPFTRLNSSLHFYSPTTPLIDPYSFSAMPSSTTSSTPSSNPSSNPLSSLAPSSRLLLVSNRLPVVIECSPDGSYTFTPGSGGLVSGLSGLSKSTEFEWYGWPGLEVPESEERNLTERLRDEYGAVPVFLDDGLADLYYNGFASTLSRSPSLLSCRLMIRA